jgi:hypothetical protein
MVMQCPLFLKSLSINNSWFAHFWVVTVFLFGLPKSPSIAPPNTQTWSLYNARLLCLIANEWIVALVQMGFGSSPCVMGLWYQPATRLFIRNSTMSLTTLVLCFFISQICFWDHKYVFHLGKVFYHLVKVIFSLFASVFFTLCPNLLNSCMSSHVPREMPHMASLVYSKIWDFYIFLYCTVLSSSS